MQLVPRTYNGIDYNDFYFICRIKYTGPPTDIERFDVYLIADWWWHLHKTTDAYNLDVIYTSSEVAQFFQSQVTGQEFSETVIVILSMAVPLMLFGQLFLCDCGCYRLFVDTVRLSQAVGLQL